MTGAANCVDRGRRGVGATDLLVEVPAGRGDINGLVRQGDVLVVLPQVGSGRGERCCFVGVLPETMGLGGRRPAPPRQFARSPGLFIFLFLFSYFDSYSHFYSIIIISTIIIIIIIINNILLIVIYF